MKLHIRQIEDLAWPIATRPSILEVVRGDGGEKLSISFYQSEEIAPLAFVYALRQLSEAIIDKFHFPVKHDKPPAEDQAASASAKVG